MSNVTIKIEWSENGNVPEGKTFESVEEFDALIFSVLPTCPKDGCYDKTKFVVTCNGDDYTGRLDLVHPTSPNKADQFYGLADHMRAHCTYQIERSTLATDADKASAAYWLKIVDLMEHQARTLKLQAEIAALETEIEQADDTDPEQDDSEVVYQGFTRQALLDAFDVVRDSADWRAPINEEIVIEASEDIVRYRAAVEFFTATTPTFTPLADGQNVYRVEATGYRMGPAGDN